MKHSGAGLDHLQACPHCPNFEVLTQKGMTFYECRIYADTSWVNRIGGCPAFPYRELPTYLSYVDGRIIGRGRIGQQKQKHNDRKYASKNDRRRKF
jgi:hypothetical protein